MIFIFGFILFFSALNFVLGHQAKLAIYIYEQKAECSNAVFKCNEITSIDRLLFL